MITFQNVTFTYPGLDCPVFRDLNFHVPLHDFQFLVGESGAGKTTILKMLIKELEVQQGRVLVNAHDLSAIKKRDVPKYRRRIGFVSQNVGLLEDKTVYENIEIAKRAVGADNNTIRIQVAMALRTVGMVDYYQKYPTELSGGQQKRVCIARAIVNHPDLLIADEPTGNLDPQGSIEIMDLFCELHRQGMTLLVATHDTEILRGYEFPQIQI